MHFSSIGLDFLGSDAPPFLRLNSWNVTSQQNARRKPREISKLVRGGGCYLGVNKGKERERKVVSLCWIHFFYVDSP